MNNFNKISEAIKYIDKNLNDALSVELIAEHFAFSPYYFHRLFTTVVGKSMIAYVRDRRVAYACKMLNETDQKVLDIALDCGFDSAQSFSRSFKSVIGMSPTEYRNKTAEIWKHFINLDKEYPLKNKVSDDGYEVRIFDSTMGGEKVFVGCEIKENVETKVDCSVYEYLKVPSSEYASFDVYVEDGYESENDAMSEWLISNEHGYVRNLFEGKPYCVEHYDARFNGNNAESIVEIWLPVKKER